MEGITVERMAEFVELSEQLRAGRDAMLEPHDLPGRFGMAIRAVGQVLRVMNCEAVLAGGWAVWRHGFAARITEDIDIVLPAVQIEVFLRSAEEFGFERLPQPSGRWSKVRHDESGIKVDILPEGARPGSSQHPAPTTIPHPRTMGAVPGRLRYISLPSLFELKLAARRARDHHDVVELIRANPTQVTSIRDHLSRVHVDYVLAFERLRTRAQEDDER